MDTSAHFEPYFSPLASSIPPPLPPTVEEAYRRKCNKLRQRSNEVEKANDAARLRLARLKRQIEKLRLERVFLYEQLAKRTSANVEDSDGSPSPPPTPKEKPLRLKRGHRKASVLANIDGGGGAGSSSLGPGSTFISQNPQSHSPSSDAFSTQPGNRLNGIHKEPKKPRSAFDLYCDETRPTLKEKSTKDDNGEEETERRNAQDEELERGWQELDENRREEFESRADHNMAKYERQKDEYDEAKEEERERAEEEREEREEREQREQRRNGTAGEDSVARSERAGTEDKQTREEQAQEDVEMGNYDTDQDTQPEGREN
ncbi:hypothetical protein QBC35DRAFT_470386 [Podospora australis]|uniref:HMG box domain-containing protein n=1 Tax=Podospora australis TaxID=1536484 RepID=A0AAN7ANS5_9PEZI|nr:hypothetical protein QBC35DRAFT_470386 [Podospora australis]